MLKLLHWNEKLKNLILYFQGCDSHCDSAVPPECILSNGTDAWTHFRLLKEFGITATSYYTENIYRWIKLSVNICRISIATYGGLFVVQKQLIISRVDLEMKFAVRLTDLNQVCGFFKSNIVCSVCTLVLHVNCKCSRGTTPDCKQQYVELDITGTYDIPF